MHLKDELAVRAPGAGEAQVRVLASGICHSDLNAMDFPMMPTPIVLGHEAAGVVAAVGAGVVNVKIGEPVMVGSQTPCDSQVTQVWPLAEFETAMAALRSGKVVRAVLDHTA